MTITLDGERYEVVEVLSPVSAGGLAMMVKTETGDRVAVRIDRRWRWWTTGDRVKPLAESRRDGCSDDLRPARRSPSGRR